MKIKKAKNLKSIRLLKIRIELVISVIQILFRRNIVIIIIIINMKKKKIKIIN